MLNKKGDMFIVGVVAMMFLVVVVTVCLAWHQAGIRRVMINKIHNTAYTTQEVFWAYGTIQKMLEGEKYRLELSEPARRWKISPKTRR